MHDVTAIFAKLTRDYGMTTGQMAVLTYIATKSGEALRVGEIATVLDFAKPNVTKAADKLEDYRLAVRRREPGDRRQIRIVPTAAGRSLVSSLLALRPPVVRRAA